MTPLCRFCVTFLLLAGFSLSMAPLATAATGAGLENYAGDWVMKLGSRNLIVMSLHLEHAMLSGRVIRPKQFQMKDSVTFYGIKATPVTEIVALTSANAGVLRFSINKPGSPPEDGFEMKLSGPDVASVQPAGSPFEPFLFTRVPAGVEVKVTTDWDPEQTYVRMTSGSQPEQPETQRVRVNKNEPDTPSTANMREIYEADQAARSGNRRSKEEWAAIQRDDRVRRKATLQLLAHARLETAKDFEYAALVLQHGASPDDYLIAHALAIISVAKGNNSASWIAAATFDRYLQSAGKPQIFGTQFLTVAGQPTTQEPYNRDLISDTMRQFFGVPPLEEQRKQVERLSSQQAPQ